MILQLDAEPVPTLLRLVQEGREPLVIHPGGAAHRLAIDRALYRQQRKRGVVGCLSCGVPSLADSVRPMDHYRRLRPQPKLQAYALGDRRKYLNIRRVPSNLPVSVPDAPR